MIKLLALDIDGTLLNSHGKISTKNKEAIQSYKNNGGIISLVSGRAITELGHFVDELGLGEFMHVGCSGGVVGYVKGVQEIVAHFDNDSYIRALSKFREIGIEYYVFDVDNIYHENADKTLEGLRKFAFNSDIIKADLNNLKAPFKICANFTNDEELAKLKAVEVDYMDSFIAADGFLDYAVKGINKFTGVSHLSTLYDIDNDEIAALGDDENDLAMLVGVGHGYAMKNARDSVLDKVDKVLEVSNDENGVAYFINKYIMED